VHFLIGGQRHTPNSASTMAPDTRTSAPTRVSEPRPRSPSRRPTNATAAPVAPKSAKLAMSIWRNPCASMSSQPMAVH
jgi:hypothetical protein